MKCDHCHKEIKKGEQIIVETLAFVTGKDDYERVEDNSIYHIFNCMKG